jgi:iron complex outermembrane receptor protein
LTGSLLDLLDLERVEIARGPQGTLSGRNSIGGTVKLFSVQPGPDQDGSMQVTIGEYNRVDVRAAAGFTLAEDTLYARVSGASRSRDGYVKRMDYKCLHPTSPLPTYSTGRLSNCELGTEGGISYTAARAALRWIPTDDFEIAVTGDITNDSSEAPPGVLLRVNEQINNPNICCDASILQGHPNGYSVGGLGTEEGTFFDIDGDLSTTGDRVYYSNEFVPYGPFHEDPVVNDPYVTYSTYLDPNSPLPTRPFSPVAIPPINHLDMWGLSAKIDWQLTDNLELESITAFREYESDFAQDADGTPLNSQLLLQHLDHEQFTQELRLNGSAFDQRVNYTLGGFYLDQEGKHETNVNLYYVQLNFIHGPDPTPSDSKALFGHVAWSLTDRLNLSAGVRYTEDHKEYTYRRRNIDGTLPGPCVLPPPGVPAPGYPNGAGPWDLGNPSNCALFDPEQGVPLFDISAEFDSDRTDYRVALDYQFSDSLMTYGQVSTGYKGGGVNPRPFFIVQIETFDPEEMTTYEVGIKSELLDRTMRLNAAFFSNDYEKIQITQVACETLFGGFGAPCLQPANAGNADVTGFEAELTWLATDKLMFDAAVSTLDFEYTSVDPNTAVGLDMITPYTPELKWSAGVQYGFGLGNGGSMIARLDAHYQDEIYTEPLNGENNLIEDYTIVNGRLTWTSPEDRWDVALEVTNLTDEVYYLTKFFDQFQSSGTISGSIAAPRMWAVTVRRNFDL